MLRVSAMSVPPRTRRPMAVEHEGDDASLTTSIARARGRPEPPLGSGVPDLSRPPRAAAVFASSSDLCRVHQPPAHHAPDLAQIERLREDRHTGRLDEALLLGVQHVSGHEDDPPLELGEAPLHLAIELDA